ncbi:helix-hairpin-helix domain-containing protein, partial [Deinococcus pimensis]|uniref:helix-hairpin-helix domain-containing protein n=1 Tax=Deinococcus pimensis TaxID=309888 RepID=UPI0005EB6AB4
MTKTPAPAPSSPAPFKVRGSVNRVRFRAESGFAVLTASIENEEGRDTDATLVGMVPPLDAGDTFSAEVTLEEHKEYGYQYRVQTLILDDVPVQLSEEGVAAYLQARVGGVGKVLAGRIAQHFGAATFDILTDDPDRLLQVPGVTRTTLHKIVQSWEDAGGERRLIAGLQGLGLSVSQAQRALKHFGSSALERLRQDIYALTEIEGVGFLTADKLAEAQGVARDDPRRLTAAAVYALQQAQLAGGH